MARLPYQETISASIIAALAACAGKFGAEGVEVMILERKGLGAEQHQIDRRTAARSVIATSG